MEEEKAEGVVGMSMTAGASIPWWPLTECCLVSSRRLRTVWALHYACSYLLAAFRACDAIHSLTASVFCFEIHVGQRFPRALLLGFQSHTLTHRLRPQWTGPHNLDITKRRRFFKITITIDLIIFTRVNVPQFWVVSKISTNYSTLSIHSFMLFL